MASLRGEASGHTFGGGLNMTRRAIERGPVLARILIVLASLLSVVGLTAYRAAAPLASDQKSLLSEIKDKGELRVGYAVADPHQFKDPTTGEWKGIAVDIMTNWAE